MWLGSHNKKMKLFPSWILCFPSDFGSRVILHHVKVMTKITVKLLNLRGLRRVTLVVFMWLTCGEHVVESCALWAIRLENC